MAAIVSNAVTGNWSATGTWAGGVVPVDGDTVTLANGANITVDVDTTVGSDPATAGTAAIAWPAAPTAATSLTIAAGKTLRVKGGIAIKGHSTTPFEAGTLTLAAGAALVFDPKATAQHTIDFTNHAELVCNGTAGSHCTVRTDLTRTGQPTLTTGSGASLLGQGLATHGGLTTASYTDFSNFGTTSANAIGLVTYLNNNYGTSLTVSITNCTFTAASYWWLAETFTGGVWDGAYTLADCIWTSTPAFTFASYSMGVGFSTASVGNTSTKQVTRCSFDAGVLFDSMVNVKFSSCVFAAGKGDNGTSSWVDDSYFDSNLVVWPTTASGTMSGSIKNVYNVLPAARNCWQTSIASSTATGCVFEQVAGSSSATTAAFRIGSSAHALTVTRSFVLSNQGGGTSMRMVQQVANGSITMDHCLLWGNGGVLGCGIDLADSAVPTAGKVPSCRANTLFYPTAASNTYLITENAGGGAFVTDVVTVANYNGMFNANNGSCKGNSGGTSASIPGYLSLQTSDVGTPPTTHLGLNDLQADPVFADQTYRGIVGWANRTQGQAATWAATIAYLQANPSLVPTMLQWVRAGYVPTNVAYKNATYPGDTMTTDANGNALNGTIGPMGFPSVATTGAAALLAAM
jgi:hypothetical protein